MENLSIDALEIVNQLVAQGIDWDELSLDDIVDEAIVRRNLELVKELVAQGARLYDDTLNLACRIGDLGIVKYIVSQGFNIRGEDDDEEPLLKAVQYGHLDIVKYLVENGADVKIDDDRPIAIAALGHLDIVKYLISQGANMYPALYKASENGRLEVVKYLVSQGVNVKAWGNEAVRLALRNKQYAVSDYLISLDFEYYLSNPEFSDYTTKLLDTLKTIRNIQPPSARTLYESQLNYEIMDYLYPSEVPKQYRKRR